MSFFNPFSLSFARGYTPVPKPEVQPEVNLEGVTVVYRFTADSGGRCGGGCGGSYEKGAQVGFVAF